MPAAGRRANALRPSAARPGIGRPAASRRDAAGQPGPRRPVAGRRGQPEPARRPALPALAGPAGARPARLTSRAAALALVVCVVALMLAYPTREYLAQRAAIAATARQNAAEQQRVDALQRLVNRWQDPAYVRAQARQRLQYALPGETAYVVLAPTPQPSAQPAGQPQLAVTPSGPARTAPWYTQLWGTVRTADGAARR